MLKRASPDRNPYGSCRWKMFPRQIRVDLVVGKGFPDGSVWILSVGNLSPTGSVWILSVGNVSPTRSAWICRWEIFPRRDPPGFVVEKFSHDKIRVDFCRGSSFGKFTLAASALFGFAVWNHAACSLWWLSANPLKYKSCPEQQQQQ